MKYVSGLDYFQKTADVEIDPKPHPCPVCEQVIFEEGGSYDICEVCGWEDDPVQEAEPELATGANHMSLTKARQHWTEHGKPIP